MTSTIVSEPLSAPTSAQPRTMSVIFCEIITDFALACGSEPVVDAVCTAVDGSALTGCELDAGSDSCEDRSSDVCYVGDTR